MASMAYSTWYSRPITKLDVMSFQMLIPNSSFDSENCLKRYLLQYGESIPCEQLVSWLCDVKQAYTQYGGKRPFGVSLLYAGWDHQYGFQLYQSDPSGNYGGWKATCIGNNSAAAVSMLKQVCCIK